jgi:hypothetical protein
MKNLFLILAVAVVAISCNKEELTPFERVPHNVTEEIRGEWHVDVIQKWDGNECLEVHQVNQDLYFHDNLTLLVSGEGLEETLPNGKYTYHVSDGALPLVISSPLLINSGCLRFLHNNTLRFSRATHVDGVVYVFHCKR